MDKDISSMTLDELKDLLEVLKKMCFIVDDPTVSLEEIDRFNRLFDGVLFKISELS